MKLASCQLSGVQNFKVAPRCLGYCAGYSDWLRDGQSRDQIPGEGGRFSALVKTGSGAHPASYTIGTGTFPGVKGLGCSFDHSLPSSAEAKERVQLHAYSPSGHSWPVPG